ncbi:MAG: hypothetical protein APF76_16685 [Desulfitibacter sp. BRH_c19]|nr:MAG: hypothetical protein APF76_16685 [Desulfitibacter sp. BRH_c19]
MARVTFHEDWCKGCELCSAFCPKNLISLADRINENGYRPAAIVEIEKCTGCMACAIVCPDVVIKLEREVS